MQQNAREEEQRETQPTQLDNLHSRKRASTSSLTSTVLFDGAEQAYNSNVTGE